MKKKRILYFFYEKDTNKISKCSDIDNYELLKDKNGTLFEVTFRYIINDYLKKHIISHNIMIFRKYTEKEIKDDLGWAEDSGISNENPFSFNLIKSLDNSNKELDNTPTINKVEFEKYIDEYLPKLNQYNFNDNNAYIDTYENLLSNFYNNCKITDKNFFNIKEYE